MKTKTPKSKKGLPKKGPVSHVTKGSLFDDINLSPEEAAISKYKFDLHHEIMAIIQKLRLTQRDLSKIFDEPQSRISELMTGKLSKMSLHKLLVYLDRLGWEIPIRVVKKAG